jgi:uncharacterized glyoxalase superfamily protein PhnB
MADTHTAQRAVPMLSYEDVARASGWLQRAFGFREADLVADEDGTVSHAERARAAGAQILRGPVDEFFGRIYAAADLEGHRWMFHQL